MLKTYDFFFQCHLVRGTKIETPQNQFNQEDSYSFSPRFVIIHCHKSQSM